jgi:antitoxin component of MazEF toxin-antitoxin module
MKKIIARKNGGSCIVSIPSTMCAAVGILPGTVLNVEQTGDKITLSPMILLPPLEAI